VRRYVIGKLNPAFGDSDWCESNAMKIEEIYKLSEQLLETNAQGRVESEGTLPFVHSTLASASIAGCSPSLKEQ
jgi:hypothetical protein